MTVLHDSNTYTLSDALSYVQLQGCLQILRLQLVEFSAPSNLLLPQKERQRHKNLRNALLGST